jgi:hypothetical protein
MPDRGERREPMRDELMAGQCSKESFGGSNRL